MQSCVHGVGSRWSFLLFFFIFPRRLILSLVVFTLVFGCIFIKILISLHPSVSLFSSLLFSSFQQVHVPRELTHLMPKGGTGGEMGRWDAHLVPLLPSSVKVFASAGAGYDWADIDLLAAHGILYCNGAAASSEAVADMALWHIIGVFRNMQWTSAAARSGDPDAFVDAHLNAQYTAHNPQGHVLGIVGLGHIGYRIATKAFRALGMTIRYFDVVPKSQAADDAIGARRVDTLRELLAQADCVVLAAPGQAAGDKKLLDRDEIGSMKKGSRLVNIARGNLVNEEAVADALEQGHLFAVGLDVFENEPVPNPRLARHRQATLTSHTAGGALDTTIGFEKLAMQNVLAVLTGEDPLTPVNKHLLAST